MRAFYIKPWSTASLIGGKNVSLVQRLEVFAVLNSRLRYLGKSLVNGLVIDVEYSADLDHAFSINKSTNKGIRFWN